MIAWGTSATRLVAIVCAAQVLVQIGAFFWPALLPEMMLLWRLSNSDAGWITAIFYAAYMVAVPVLVTLTDRVDAKLVYLSGVGCTIAGHLLFAWLADGFWSAMATRALTGVGWAGTYMTGLRLLADRVDPKLMSRAVTGHAASIGISGALSFLVADLLVGVAGLFVPGIASAVPALSDPAAAWTLLATGVAAVMVLPVVTIAVLALTSKDNVWSHLVHTVLARALSDTAVLLIGVSALVLIFGTATA